MRAPVRFGLAAAVMALAACTVQADSSGNLELVGLSVQTRSADDFRWQGTLAPGQTVEIKGVNGSIAAGPSTSGQIEVLARRAGRRSDPESVTIEVVPHPGGVTICAVYPSPDGRPNECAPGGNGRMNTRDNDVKVDFTVSVPTGLVFAGRTVNGSVRADGLDNNLSLETVNGGVTFSTTGYASASTVNGSIRGALGRADWTDDLEFQTVNGSITLDLPESLSTDVEARTVNGAISTDFPLTVSGRFSNRRLSGVIGGGGRRLSLETVNGGITLRRR